MILLITFYLAVLADCYAHIGGGIPPNQDLESHVYCGRRLARMLAYVCDYNVKRSGSGSMMQHILAPYYEAQEQHGWPYKPSQKLKSKEFDALPHKMDSPSDWPQKSDSEYMRLLKTRSYGLPSNKINESEDWPARKHQDAEDWPARKSQDAEYWQWLTRNEARGLDLPSRNKRYVVSECCEKPCTVEELTSYC